MPCSLRSKWMENQLSASPWRRKEICVSNTPVSQWFPRELACLASLGLCPIQHSLDNQGRVERVGWVVIGHSSLPTPSLAKPTKTTAATISLGRKRMGKGLPNLWLTDWGVFSYKRQDWEGYMLSLRHRHQIESQKNNQPKMFQRNQINL